MATAKPSNLTEIEDIQRRMAQLRHDMHGEVVGAVESARSLTDWRSLARNHPLATLGVVAAIGYLVVPRRREAVPTIVAVSAPAPEPAALATSQKQTRSTAWNIMGTVFGLVVPIVVRAAQNYAIQYIEGLLATQELPPEEAGLEGRHAANPRTAGRASGTLGATSSASLRK